MSIYFSSKYKKYYDKLSSSNLEGASASLSNDVLILRNVTSKLNEQINSSSWNELGKDEINLNVLSNINDSTTHFVNGVEKGLVRASEIAHNSLLPLHSKAILDSVS